MIGGLLFRYWEGGTTARSGNPNVYINWAQKKRPEQPPAPQAKPRPQERVEAVVLVPLPALCRTGRVGVAGRAPTAFSRTSEVNVAAGVVAPVALAARVVAYPTGARAALPDALLVSAASPDVHPEMDAASLRRLDIIEHNRRAIAAIAAAMLADDD